MSSDLARSLRFAVPFSRHAAVAWLAAMWLAAAPLQAQYSPDHPKVQAMVANGIKFLSGPAKGPSGAGYADGQDMLVGYTFLKVTGDTEHPRVKAAINIAVNLCNGLASYRERGESKIVYEASVAAVLLASADATKYRPQLEQVLAWFQQVQKPHGGFGYLERATGDTSQVQYVMLALWTMHEVGVDIPPRLVESTLQYLKATLDPSGAWGYQGKPSVGRLVPQDGPTKSLGTAGIGAVIIGGDILGFYGARKKPNDEAEGIPDAFKRIDLIQKMRAERREITMTRADTDGVLSLAMRYQNSTGFQGLNWYYYWRYSQERYESFVEIIEGKQNKSPAWYNAGVEELAKLQDPAGSWGDSGMKSAVTSIDVDTAFAILFLIRSTQKSIGKLDEGLAFGGYELPNDVSQVKMVGDRIVSDAETSVENLLTMLEDEGDQVQVGLLPDDLQLTSDPVQRQEQVARLARLLSSRDPNARRIAAKLLGRSEDLDQVPDLIYALTDPDPYVPMIAEESLRLLSRKLTAGKLGAQPKPAEQQAAVTFWKQWYLGLRPDFIFLER